MQLVNCPNCYAKVPVEYDECPNCGKPIYDYEYKEDHKDYEDHYTDYLTTNHGTRPVYKILSTVSFIAILVGLYLLFFVHREEQGPPEVFYLVYGSMAVFAVVRILIWMDTRKYIRE